MSSEEYSVARRKGRPHQQIPNCPTATGRLYPWGAHFQDTASIGWSLRELYRTLETLRDVSWKDFEYLVAEAYRRQGFAVDYSLSKGADGGVDLGLREGGRRALVQ